MNPIRSLALIAALVIGGPALAQDKGTLDPKPLPSLANPNDPKLAAKELFGRRTTPASLQARSIGSYARGCVAGAAAIPVDGETWQVMRLSRNRNWGHPQLIALLQRLSARVPSINGWPGLLIGDISQPRGGPMITGHASHQIGLDADVWLTPMPDRRLSRLEREEMSATNMVRSDWLDVDPAVWTPQHTALIRAAASEKSVARIFVNPAIKKALCREAGQDRGWLSKVRPMFGHNYHFHIRIACPAGDATCSDQDPPPRGDGCGEELAGWFTPEMLHPKPGKPRPPLTMAHLPEECGRVLVSP
ncbi:penicillin-insensitive murein endopeptidase [Microvirga sp. KLBC 81]|uniref:penicillin-insensitive murein endopeptidase n=1 Tax=Microvirga sp. KLBC 81 TaxID=1862707 RepID=UPI000D50E2C6|nr:penicillin-insensitive murein endopeptidase [Microvirga sp. KLBC 81]PVE25813.1 penicillin-insensitive murein endopeptidase [Microvirga sp. KLBC 81]